jgi:hypothetical protein
VTGRKQTPQDAKESCKKCIVHAKAMSRQREHTNMTIVSHSESRSTKTQLRKIEIKSCFNDALYIPNAYYRGIL